MNAPIQFVRDGVTFVLERNTSARSHALNWFVVRALTQGEHDEQEADARDMTTAIRGAEFAYLDDCVRELRITTAEIEAAR